MEKSSLLMPQFKLEAEYGSISVIAVYPDNGKKGAYICLMTKSGIRCPTAAQRSLLIEGLNSDWAEWDNQGAFVRLLD